MGTLPVFWLFVIMAVACFVVHGLGGSSNNKISFRDFGLAFATLAFAMK